MNILNKVRLAGIGLVALLFSLTVVSLLAATSTSALSGSNEPVALQGIVPILDQNGDHLYNKAGLVLHLDADRAQQAEAVHAEVVAKLAHQVEHLESGSNPLKTEKARETLQSAINRYPSVEIYGTDWLESPDHDLDARNFLVWKKVD